MHAMKSAPPAASGASALSSSYLKGLRWCLGILGFRALSGGSVNGLYMGVPEKLGVHFWVLIIQGTTLGSP